MYFVYILKSEKDSNKIYIGFTHDLTKRLAEHNTAQSTYSKRYAPWKLVSYTAFIHKTAALAFETYLKSGSGFAFLKKRFLS